jgi:hypothetical protein
MSGLIMFHHKACAVIDKASMFRVKYPTINNPTVQQIYPQSSRFTICLQLLTKTMSNWTVNYRFSPQGNGCAFWAYTFLVKIEVAGYLDTGTANQVWGSM